MCCVGGEPIVDERIQVSPLVADLSGEFAYFMRLGSHHKSDLIYRGSLKDKGVAETFGMAWMMADARNKPSARWRIGNGFVWQLYTEEFTPGYPMGRIRRIPADEFERFKLSRAARDTPYRAGYTAETDPRDVRQVELREHGDHFTVSDIPPLREVAVRAELRQQTIDHDIVPVGPASCVLFVRRANEIGVHRVDIREKVPRVRNFAGRAYVRTWSFLGRIGVEWDGPFWTIVAKDNVYFVTSDGKCYSASCHPSARDTFTVDASRIETEGPVIFAFGDPAVGSAFVATTKRIYALAGEKTSWRYEGPGQIGEQPKDWLSLIREALAPTRLNGE